MNPNPKSTADFTQALDASHPESFARESLARTLAEVRRQRRRRRVAMVVCAVGIVALGLVAWFQPIAPATSTVVHIHPAPSQTPVFRIRIEEISDEELLSFFPGRTAGFATVDGHREFILLPERSAE